MRFANLWATNPECFLGCSTWQSEAVKSNILGPHAGLTFISSCWQRRCRFQHFDLWFRQNTCQPLPSNLSCCFTKVILTPAFLPQAQVCHKFNMKLQVGSTYIYEHHQHHPTKYRVFFWAHASGINVMKWRGIYPKVTWMLVLHVCEIWNGRFHHKTGYFGIAHAWVMAPLHKSYDPPQ